MGFKMKSIWSLWRNLGFMMERESGIWKLHVQLGFKMKTIWALWWHFGLYNGTKLVEYENTIWNWTLKYQFGLKIDVGMGFKINLQNYIDPCLFFYNNHFVFYIHAKCTVIFSSKLYMYIRESVKLYYTLSSSQLDTYKARLIFSPDI